MRCPTCDAPVAFGETLCGHCGTDLSLSAPTGAAATAEAPEPPHAEHRACADCGAHVVADANGLCPVCGGDVGAPIEIDDAEFLREPPSLDAVFTAARRRLAADARLGALGVGTGSAAAFVDPGRVRAAGIGGSGDATPPLPGDRSRTRYRDPGGDEPPMASAVLEVEGGQTVFFEGSMTARVALFADEVLVGRRDPAAGHYPDIDLAHYRELDAHLSRRHARFVRAGGRWFIEDLCANDATYLNDRAHPLNRERAALDDGDRVFISDSVALVFRLAAG